MSNMAGDRTMVEERFEGYLEGDEELEMEVIEH